jgi:hydrogenase maturation protein HypF
MREVGRPVVATSGNLSDEPICIDESEAARRLGGIADAFLVHDRPIERPVDDSVTQWLAGAPRPVRRARGYAPLPVSVRSELPPILAVGGHLKNTIALARGTDVFLSQHIGDLETPQARDAFERAIADFLRLYEIEPIAIAHDQHPGYASTAWAMEAAERWDGRRLVGVQHHHAHLASCLADHDVDGPALGVIWDGTGLGPDGTIWGGEFLLGDAAGYERVAHLRPFRLPGGDAAVKEPRRMALALAHAAWGEAGVQRVVERAQGSWGRGDLRVLLRILETGLRSPWTTSAGRLFDGVAALLGLRQRAGFEGEAAMALEYAVDRAETGSYELEVVTGDGPMVVDWAPALETLMDDQRGGAPVPAMAARFHNGLAAVIADVAERVGIERVALSGGCFQNAVLAEGAARALERRGLTPLLHRRVPANDGGLALGQVAVAAAAMTSAMAAGV